MNQKVQASRLRDIAEAITAIRKHMVRGTLDDELIFDACRMRVVEIGEAVKALSPDLTAKELSVPWSSIARMRDRLVHHYKGTDTEIVAGVIAEELDDLHAAVGRLHAHLTTPADQTTLKIDREPSS